MFKLLVSLFICFSFNFVNAEEVKKDKKYENMSEEQLMAEFMKTYNEGKQIEKTQKTVDEIKNKLGIDKENSKPEQKKVIGVEKK